MIVMIVMTVVALGGIHGASAGSAYAGSVYGGAIYGTAAHANGSLTNEGYGSRVQIYEARRKLDYLEYRKNEAETALNKAKLAYGLLVMEYARDSKKLGLLIEVDRLERLFELGNDIDFKESSFMDWTWDDNLDCNMVLIDSTICY
jgi:hypothetical protein